MVRGNLAALALWLIAAPLVAAEPPHYTFAQPPPGTIEQSRVVYLAGEGMQSQWRGVVSRTLVGTDAGMSFYQWYVSIYQIDYDAATYHLRYQSPKNGGPLDTVEQAVGAHMWYPLQSASIAGVAQLMEPSREELVVQTHQTGADCGSADVTVFGYDAKANKAVPEVTLENGCDLNVKVVRKGALDVLQLSGPYYAPSAAMCCPTKPKATAVLRYVNGVWKESPNYFRFFVRSFPH